MTLTDDECDAAWRKYMQNHSVPLYGREHVVLRAGYAAGLAAIQEVVVNGGHIRGCEGRNYTCTCGYDQAVYDAAQGGKP